MSTIKFSRQREAIKDYLFHTTDHPTADTIYEHIKEIYPNISLGTVYRNLNLLISQGEIIKLSGLDESDRFDGNTQNHYHFICTKCHCLLDLPMDSIEHINVIASAKFDGVIDGHKTYFYGKCPACKD
jgi:Fur family transcriptional regulator, peroxide stress response regulator